MEKLVVNYKLLDDRAVKPYYHSNNAGIDLTAIEINWINDELIEYDTGVAFEIPKYHVGLLHARSSVSKQGLILANGVGVIDPSYRGSIRFRFYARGTHTVYLPGHKIGQLVIVPQPAIALYEVDALSDTERGTGGFGSTGK